MADRTDSIADFKAAALRRGSSTRLYTKYDPLLMAVNSGRLDSVRTVFAEGYDLHGMGEAATALHTAFDNGHLNIVQYLVRQKGLNVDTPDRRGQTCFHKACHKLDKTLMNDLFDMKADVNKAQEEDGWTPIHIAASKGSLELTQALVDRGAHPATKTAFEDEEGNCPSPLDLAKKEGHLNVVEYLENETDPVLLELKERKNRCMAKLAPDAKKIVNNQLSGPMEKADLQPVAIPDLPVTPSYTILTNLQGLPVSESMLANEFDALDVDGNGYIMKEEFVKLYDSFENFGAPRNKIEQILNDYNLVADDKLSFEEYCVLRLAVVRR